MAGIKILTQFSLSDDAVMKDVQFALKSPLGRIPKDQRPVSGELIISDMEAGIFQLCTGDNFFDLEIVNQQHRKLMTDLLYRGMVCLAEVMTFHDLTEADDVRGVVILYAAFFRKGFRLAGGMNIKLSGGIIESLRKKGFSATPENIRDNFIVDVGDKISRFMYSQGQSSQDDEESANEHSDGTQKGFRLAGKKYAVDVVIEESKGFEYLAAQRVVFRQRKPDSINTLKLARSELSFSDKNISPVSRMLTEALTESASYADTWERYSAMEGNFLLKRARAVGVLRFERITGLENGRTAIYVHRAENGAAPVFPVPVPCRLLRNQRAFCGDDRLLEHVLGGLCGNDHGEPFRLHHPRLLAAAEGQTLHQRRGALQGLGTLGVAEDAGHPGARADVAADRLSHRRAGGGGTEYAFLMEDEK